MVSDLVMSTEPKLSLSTQLISPPAKRLSCAACIDRHGVARVQLGAASLPLLATQALDTSASAGVPGSNAASMATRLAERKAIMRMADSHRIGLDFAPKVYERP